MAVGLSILLAIAWNLTPDTRGYGTHHQLGFPDCTFIVLWGIPCPMCGMTTSWAYLMNGQVFPALTVNPGGALLGMTSLVAVPVCAWRAWKGVSTHNNWLSRLTLVWLCLIVFVIALFWIWQLRNFRIFSWHE